MLVLSCIAFLGLAWRLSSYLSAKVSFYIHRNNASLPLEINVDVGSAEIFFISSAVLIFGVSLLLAGITLFRSRRLADKLSILTLVYDDLLKCAKNVAALAIYRSSDGRPKIDIRRMHVRHTIEIDGTTQVSRSYLIYCPKHRATAFEIWIEADDESEPVSGYRGLNLQLEDRTLGQELDWIPTSEGLRRKQFAIFFPEIEPGTEKEIEVFYTWPRFMARLLERGSADFWWAHKAATENATAHVTYEWLYKAGFPEVCMRLGGVHGETASLKYERRPEGLCWIYVDANAKVDKRDYKVVVDVEKLSGTILDGAGAR
jgi:hypothetical protein